MTTKPRLRNSMNVSLHIETVKLIDDIRNRYEPRCSRNDLIAFWAKRAAKELAGCREIACEQTGDLDGRHSE